jgi:RNA polymerase sigma-70 factor (ECF subfamily)
MRRLEEKTVIICESFPAAAAIRRVVYSSSMASRHDVTRLLHEWANGAQSALDALTPLVYAELRRLAANYLRNEAPGHTLQPTALVHEAFLRMVGRDAPHCQNRSEFYGMAAHLMRQILIDHARTRHAGKRGGRVAHLTLEEDLIGSRGQDAGLMALDEALNRLAALAPRKAQVVEMRFFGGLSVAETVEALKVSEVTVRRDWQFAKAWLLHELRDEKRDGP